MSKKELKRDLKLYKSDLNSMAEESIKYKELVEKATATCIRLVAKLQECRERAEKAEAMVEQLIETILALNSAQTKKVVRKMNRKLSDDINEWQSSKANNG